MKTFILASLLALTAMSGSNPAAAGSLPAAIGGAVGQAAGSVGSAVGTIFGGGTHAATPVQTLGVGAGMKPQTAPLRMK